MGSDAITKSSRPKRIGRYLWWILGIAVFIFLALFWTHQPSSFALDLDSIPPHCQAYAARFQACQSQHNNKHTLTLGCHRKWCNSWGYCSPGGGIGSRFRYALTIMERAVQLCIPIKLDAPSQALRINKEALYKDPMGFVAELLHFRSYGNLVEESRESWKGNVSDWLSTDKQPFYLHFTPQHWISPRPDGMPAFDYDPCLFHVLFQPSPLLETEIRKYTPLAFENIGIHFRTGDAIAFNHTQGGDVRIPVSTNYTHALDQLVACATDLAQRLNVTQNNKPFYLATDNLEVATLAQDRNDLVTLDLKRHSWKHVDDMEAWLELWLLSKTQGIVANELYSHNYKSVGDRISTFARLAAKIGFHNKQVYACKIQS